MGVTRALCLAALVLASLLSFWSTDLNTPSIELIADEAKRFGFIEEALASTS